MLGAAYKITNLVNNKVKCIETNKTFRSAKNAAITMGLRPSGISLVLNGKQKTTGGYSFVYQG